MTDTKDCIKQFKQTLEINARIKESLSNMYILKAGFMSGISMIDMDKIDQSILNNELDIIINMESTNND